MDKGNTIRIALSANVKTKMKQINKADHTWWKMNGKI